MTAIAICDCEGFTIWYVNQEDIPVCVCGHPPEEHLDQTGPCVGEVLIT